MKLSPPGAGLPQLERLTIKRVLVPAIRVFITWDIALYLLKREISIIKKITSKIDKNLCTKQVLIDRTFGIEDDTRQFSINLVLEHLTITGNALMTVIQTLSDEKEFTREITIEAVKPKENKLNQIDDFTELYERYFEFMKNLPKTQSKMTKKHPWFVGFNNFDWSVFMYMHTFIHRRQIEAIIAKLGDETDEY